MNKALLIGGVFAAAFIIGYGATTLTANTIAANMTDQMAAVPKPKPKPVVSKEKCDLKGLDAELKRIQAEMKKLENEFKQKCKGQIKPGTGPVPASNPICDNIRQKHAQGMKEGTAKLKEVVACAKEHGLTPTGPLVR